MSTITRTITAVYKIGADKYPRTKRLTFDPAQPLDKATARAHLLVMAPDGFVVCIYPDQIGPKGGWGKARYYMDRQAFLQKHREAQFYIATMAESKGEDLIRNKILIIQ